MRVRLWAGRRDRLALCVIGALVLGAGLSAMTLLGESIRGTVTRTYEQTWRAPYDILVHVPLPAGSLLPEITEPNALTTLPSGITAEQLQTVKAVAGVKVAAPIAVVGTVRVGPAFRFPSEAVAQPGAGVYRVTTTLVSHQSATPEQVHEEQIVVLPDPSGAKPAWAPDGAMFIDGKPATAVVLQAMGPTLLVGVDPTAESQLVGLDKALLQGRYLGPDEKYPPVSSGRGPAPVIPVLVNQYGFAGTEYRFRIEALDEQLRPERTVYEQRWQGAEVVDSLRQAGNSAYQLLLGQAGPLTYRPTASPFPDRWPDAVSLTPAAATDPAPDFQYPTGGPFPLPTVTAELGHRFRQWLPAANRAFQYRVTGTFDATRLSVVKNPDSQLPLMTYRPAEGVQVLNAAGRPVNPPQAIAGGLSPVGFLSSPPILLTNIPSAMQLAGDRAINAIQIKVDGTEHFTPETLDRVRQVSAAIERSTGLVAEVTLGSSPVNMLVRVPAANGLPDYGWVQEQWIHKNAAATTVHQAEFGYSSYLALVMIVAVLYALATGLAGVTARRRELGTAAAVGWPPATLGWMAASEQLLLGGLVGLIGALTATAGGAPVRTIAVALLAGVLVYLPAATATWLAAARTPAGSALRWGDTAPGRRILPGAGALPLAVSSVMGRPGRTLLTVSAIALPTALLIVLGFISRHLRGVLYTTITGQYAAMRVGSLQYAAGMIALAIAVMTAYDLIRQNAIDHRSERALLHALGWPRSRIAMTMALEGGVIGLLATLAGLVTGLLILRVLYGSGAAGGWQLSLLISLVPLGLGVVTGLVSAMTEFRDWGRASLAGVQARQVARLGARTWYAWAAAVALAAGAILIVAIPRAMQQIKSARASSRDVVAEQAAAAITEAVGRQSDALGRLDADRYAATLDPAAELFTMAERHWLEDATRWRQSHPGESLARSVADISFLGTNTARVRLLQAIGSTTSYVLETIWVQTADGRWLEHGLKYEIAHVGPVTVWYPDVIPGSVAQAAGSRLEAAARQLRDGIGWNLGEGLVLELKEDRTALQLAIGPSWLQEDTGWAPPEFGEPVRAAPQPLPGEQQAIHILAQKYVREHSGNHAAEWMQQGLARYALYKAGKMSLDSALQIPAKAAPLPLRNLTDNHPLDVYSYDRVADTVWLLAVYLDAQHGQGTVDRWLAELAHASPDPRITGPATFKERDDASIRAIESVTGRSWARIDQDFQAWYSQRARGNGNG